MKRAALPGSRPEAEGAAAAWKRRSAAALILLLGCACVGPFQRSFRLSGGITASPQLLRRTERPNLMLFIVAVNSGGIPVAVKRIVNPKLPIDYHMGQEDLVLPGKSWQGPLQVKVFVNTHGQVGLTLPGDLTGGHPGPVRSGDHDVDVVIDSEASSTGIPSRTG
ncbi:MAG: hypothetical protein AAB412_01890 [Elusimicrobiota bacterium]